MATYTRKNAWNQGGTFNNNDLIWYAKGVGVMQSKKLNDPNSWWFYAAMHSYYFNYYHSFPDWNYITESPKVPATPMPSASIIGKYWEQCQHESWYFPPWHRGYLMALEQQIRAAIAPLGGPADWALPYWNYLGPVNEHTMPPAFAEKKLPDGSTNPLFVKYRFGPPNGHGSVIINDSHIHQKCQQNTIFTGSDLNTPAPGYGGPVTGFQSLNQDLDGGNLEANPHNLVHGAIGGSMSSGDQGLMSDPGTAALDPIFYLHHGNIDRLWASWNAANNSNSSDPNWLKGPTAAGERKFVMPMPNGSDWNYTPNDVKSLATLDYAYDNLDTGIAPHLASPLAQRLSLFGLNTAALIQTKSMKTATTTELAGSNEGPLLLKTSGTSTTVKLEQHAWKQVSMSLLSVSLTAVPDRVYLKIENIKGVLDSTKLQLSVNQQDAGAISLFGLRKASTKTGHHGGAGLTRSLDITHIIDSLHLENALNAESLDILIVPGTPIPDSEKITIGRVSIYRQPQ